MKDGNCKASSTYLKIPIATAPCDLAIKSLEDAKKWLADLEAEMPFYEAQCTKLREIKKRIKEEGKQYKDIIKTKGIRSAEGRQARADYENMILTFMRKLTIREEILADDRRCDF